MSTDPLLAVDDLTVGFPMANGDWKLVVRGVTFEIRPGEKLAIVGESGSGKSLTALACLGLVPDPGRIVSGRLMVLGAEPLEQSEEKWRQLRGGEIGLVFQEASSALNPVFTVGFQISETIRTHCKTSRREGREKALQLLREVSIVDATEVAGSYPHQLSGGMAQRVMLALALAGQPRLLIADEPTSALDLATQRQILELLDRLAIDRNLSVVTITHDLSLVEATADRVLVMYDGEVVEDAPVAELFARPAHPYTRLLLTSDPGSDGLGQPRPRVRGSRSPASGCRYQPRCPSAVEACRGSAPLLADLSDEHRVRCPVVVGDRRTGDG